MWNNLSYKKRFYRMLVGVVILVWVSFKFGISPSIKLKNELDQIKVELNTIEDAPYKLKVIQKRLNDIEVKIGDISGDETKSAYLIDKVGDFCIANGMVLSEIPNKHVFAKDGYDLLTYKMVVKGGFTDLLKLLHEIEKKPVAGKVRSVSFESEYDLKTKKKYLFGSFYIQSIIGE